MGKSKGDVMLKKPLLPAVASYSAIVATTILIMSLSPSAASESKNHRLGWLFTIHRVVGTIHLAKPTIVPAVDERGDVGEFVGTGDGSAGLWTRK
jgi:hypothetical protein